MFLIPGLQFNVNCLATHWFFSLFLPLSLHNYVHWIIITLFLDCLLLCLTLQALWLCVMLLSLICILRVSLRVVIDYSRQLLGFYTGDWLLVANEKQKQQYSKTQKQIKSDVFGNRILILKQSLVSVVPCTAYTVCMSSAVVLSPLLSMTQCPDFFQLIVH